MKVIYLVIIDLVLLLVVIFCNTLTDIPLEIIRSKRLVMDLAHNDFKTRFAGSYFGILWAFVQPIVIICLYWFVFQFGFKSGSVGDYPYVLWLVAGLVPWFFFSEALTSATNALLDYRYLVKKVVFQISILPTVKIISNCFVHIFFIGFAVVIYAIMGFFPTIYLIQIVYYFLCTVAFLMALTYATSAMVLFFRDLGQIINIFMQVFMWATPIMWNEAILPGSIVWIFKLNPLYYVTMGYRDALMNHVWFFQRVGLTVYFWTVVICLFFLGTTIFKRLRPHFADVL